MGMEQFMRDFNRGSDLMDVSINKTASKEASALKLKQEAEDRTLKMNEAYRKENAQQYLYDQSGIQAGQEDKLKIKELEDKLKKIEEVQVKASGSKIKELVNQQLADSSPNIRENTEIRKKQMSELPYNPLGVDWGMPSKDNPAHRTAVKNFMAKNGMTDLSDAKVDEVMDSGNALIDSGNNITDLGTIGASIGAFNTMTPEQKASFDAQQKAILGGKKATSLPAPSTTPKSTEEINAMTDEELKSYLGDAPTQPEPTKVQPEPTKVQPEPTKVQPEVDMDLARTIAGYRAEPSASTKSAKTALQSEIDLTTQITGGKLPDESDTEYNARFLKNYKEVRTANDSDSAGSTPESIALMAVINNPDSTKEDKDAATAILKKKGYIAPQSVSSKSDVISSVVTDRDAEGTETSYVVTRSKTTGDIVSKTPVGGKAPILSQSDKESADTINAWQDNKKKLTKVLDPKYKNLFGPIDAAIASGASMAGLEVETTKKLAEVKAAASGAMITMMGTMKGNLSEGERKVLQALVPTPTDTYQEVTVKVKEFQDYMENNMKSTAKRLEKSNKGVISAGALKAPPPLVHTKKPTGEVIQNGWVYSADGKPLRKAK